MFWVIGGVYQDVSFQTLVSGTLECYGPFVTKEAAKVEWEGRSRAKIDICSHRLTIVQPA